MSTDGQGVVLVPSVDEPVATLLALLAARTRVRTWVVTAGERVAAATGPHAPERGAVWSPAGDSVSVVLPGAGGRELGRLCAVGGPVHDEGLVRIVAVSVAALLELAGALPVRGPDGGPAERRTASSSQAVSDVLAHGGPRMVFQAAVPLGASGRGFLEALSRFDDGRPPDVWFREATAAGLGVELEVAAARAGLRALGPGVDVSVNLSAATITSGALPGLLDGLALSQVVVEVSEHEAVRDYAELGAALEPHRRGGLRLAVDDAGAGYASLRHVVRLAPDVIKLDMSLVSGIDTDPSRRELAGALTSFAHRTGAVVVAEGVERRSEHEALREVGVDLGQGYLYAVPAALS